MFFLIFFNTARKKSSHMSGKNKYSKLMCYGDYICACSVYTDRLFSLGKDLEGDFL